MQAARCNGDTPCLPPCCDSGECATRPSTRGDGVPRPRLNDAPGVWGRRTCMGDTRGANVNTWGWVARLLAPSQASLDRGLRLPPWVDGRGLALSVAPRANTDTVANLVGCRGVAPPAQFCPRGLSRAEPATAGMVTWVGDGDATSSSAVTRIVVLAAGTVDRALAAEATGDRTG